MTNNLILVVEDSPTQAEALRDLLEREGARAEVADSAEEALRRLESTSELPDLVLSDVVMPGMTGYELTRRIKEDPRYDQMPVVLLTSLTNPLDIVRGLECGADNYVTKPYEPEYLVARLHHVLAQKRMRRGLRASLGVNVQFLGTTFNITSDREQILDLFLSSVEDVVRTNQALEQSQQELAAAQSQLQAYAHQMAQRAHSSAERLRTVIESSPVAIVALDTEARITVWNPGAERIFGYSAAEVLGERPTRMVPAELTEEQARMFAEVRETGRARVETRRLSKHRGVIDVVITGASLRDDAGNFDGYVATVEDVTEKKRMEAQLQASQQQLLQAQKMEAVGTLAGGIAHDFNNLLTVMRSYSAMLVEDLPPGDEENRQAAAEILAAADRAAGLTRQLLSFSRKQTLAPRLIRADDVVTGVEQMLRRLLPATIDLQLDLDGSDAVLRMDPGQLEQVVMNLVINASHAMPRGGRIIVGTRVVVSMKRQETATGPVAPGSLLALSVSDTGVGMDDATMAKLFEPFFTTKPAGTGTGLGLSIVRNVVAEQGGGINVRSKLGQGTTFEILIPLVTEPRAAAIGPDDLKGGKELIMVVHEDPGLRAEIRAALERFGYTVMDAPDGSVVPGTAGLLASAPDLVIASSALSPQALADLVTQLKRGTAAPRTMVVAEAGNTSAASAHGPARVLQQPFTREALVMMVREVLDKG